MWGPTPLLIGWVLLRSGRGHWISPFQVVTLLVSIETDSVGAPEKEN